MNWISFSMKARVNDLEFLNTLLELLNNQFKNKRAFLPLGLRAFWYNLTWWLIPTLLPDNAEILQENFDFLRPLPCQSLGQKFVSEQHLPVTWWCFSDPFLLPHCCRATTIKLHAEGCESCANHQHTTFQNKYLVPRLRWAFFRDGTTWVQNWRPERGDAAKQEKLFPLTGETLTSRAGTHFCIVDFVLYGSRQAQNLHQRLSEIHCIFLAELGLIDMVPKDPGICEKWFSWLQLITGTFYKLQGLQLISLLHHGIKSILVRVLIVQTRKRLLFCFYGCNSP